MKECCEAPKYLHQLVGFIVCLNCNHYHGACERLRWYEPASGEVTTKDIKVLTQNTRANIDFNGAPRPRDTQMIVT